MQQPLIIVRIPKKLEQHWIAKHEKDGLDEWRLTAFLKSQYLLGSYERSNEDELLFKFRFQKKGGQAMRADLWVKEKKINDKIIELIVFRGHATPLENK